MADDFLGQAVLLPLWLFVLYSMQMSKVPAALAFEDHENQHKFAEVSEEA